MLWRVMPAKTEKLPERPFDLLGSLLLSAVLVGAALLILQGLETLAVPVIAALSVVLALAALAFVRQELAHPDPVIHPGLFRRRAFAAASSGVALSNLAFYTMLIAMPIVLASNFGWSSARIGLALSLLSGPTIVFAPIGGRLSDRLGRRTPALIGLTVATAALAVLAALGDDSRTAMLAALAVAGAGFGLAIASHQTVAVEAVPASEAGAASGVFSTSRYLGSIVGTMVLAALLVTAVDDTTSGFRAVAVMTATAALLAVVVSLGLPGRDRAVSR